ncbi:unnamed protein product, partial [Urochloa humidicola]
MAPVEVFGPAMSTNVARVLVCLEEVGAEYEVVNIDFQANEHKSPEHLARNPFGQIPAFQDGDVVLFESRAISKYVLRKYKSPEHDLLREGNLRRRRWWTCGRRWRRTSTTRRCRPWCTSASS